MCIGAYRVNACRRPFGAYACQMSADLRRHCVLSDFPPVLIQQISINEMTCWQPSYSMFAIKKIDQTCTHNGQLSNQTLLWHDNAYRMSPRQQLSALCCFIEVLCCGSVLCDRHLSLLIHFTAGLFWNDDGRFMSPSNAITTAGINYSRQSMQPQPATVSLVWLRLD